MDMRLNCKCAPIKLKEIKMLHELINLAKQGKKFIARLEGESVDYREVYFRDGGWKDNAVTGKWTYEEIKEPQVVQFECEWGIADGIIRPHENHNVLKKLVNGRRWKVTCVEALDE